MKRDSNSTGAPSRQFAASSAAFPREDAPGKDSSPNPGFAFLLIVIAASAVVSPMFFLGNASGHDFGFHLASWMDVAGQWREGIVYPRWAEWANWGFGEPRFIFYPPASWTIGAALGCVLPWRMVPGAFIWLALILSGVSMWRLAREWLPSSQAIAAAVLFVVNPYQLVVVYYRSDFAELLASALFPLLVLGALRVIRDGWGRSWHGIPFLAVAFAAIWLSNAPAAVIATYSLALLLVVGCALQRNFRPLIDGGTAMAFGFGFAAFYILPAAFEQRWVQIAQVMSENLSYAQNFIFTHSIDPEFALFNWKVSGVALGMMLLGGVAAVFSARCRREYSLLWWMMLALTAASIILTLPASVWLWRYLPKLQYVQFPWRWLVPLAIPYSFFLASAIGRSRRPWISYVALGVVIAAAATAFVSDAWWDSADVPTLAAAIRSGHGYEGTDEYAPVGCDHYNLPGAILNPDSPDVFDENPAPPLVEQFNPESEEIVSRSGVKTHIDRWLANEKLFYAETIEETAIALRLVNYPAWQVLVDGASSKAISAPETAQILVRIPAGSHRVEARFRRTPDRTAGAAISFLSALLLLSSTIFVKRRRQLP
jgi:hypothetical protein